jgi:hypothetical protein
MSTPTPFSCKRRISPDRRRPYWGGCEQSRAGPQTPRPHPSDSVAGNNSRNPCRSPHMAHPPPTMPTSPTPNTLHLRDDQAARTEKEVGVVNHPQIPTNHRRGAQSPPDVHQEDRAPILLSTCPIWKAAIKTAKYRGNTTPTREPLPATATEMERVYEMEPNPLLALFIKLSWLTRA